MRLSVADTESHRYYYTLQNRANGCVDTASVMVNITRLPKLTHIEGDTMCTRESKFTFRYSNKASEVSNVQWSAVEYLPGGTQSVGRFTTPNKLTTTYWPSKVLDSGGTAHLKVYAYGVNECADRRVADSFDIVYTDPLNVSLIGNTYVCLSSGDSARVMVSFKEAYRNMAGYEWKLSDKNVLHKWDTVNKLYSLIYPNPGGDTNVVHHDTLVVWNKDHCEVVRDFVVEFVGAPHVEPDTVVMCPGDTVTVAVSNPNSVVKATWTNMATNKREASGNIVQLSPSVTTTYKVSSCGAWIRDVRAIKTIP